jgi:hypothetical protein
MLAKPAVPASKFFPGVKKPPRPTASSITKADQFHVPQAGNFEIFLNLQEGFIIFLMFRIPEGASLIGWHKPHQPHQPHACFPKGVSEFEPPRSLTTNSQLRVLDTSLSEITAPMKTDILCCCTPWPLHMAAKELRTSPHWTIRHELSSLLSHPQGKAIVIIARLAMLNISRPAGTVLSYQAIVNRQKTKKWADAKPANYEVMIGAMTRTGTTNLRRSFQSESRALVGRYSLNLNMRTLTLCLVRTKKS